MRKAMTWAKLNDRIDMGRGQGHYGWYLPWLWIHRKNASKISNQVVSWCAEFSRQTHFYCRNEWHIFLLALWLGAADVREQFPLWPMEHAHPMADISASFSDVIVPGLMDIAHDAGIKHGVEPGSRGVPYVATTDLAFTLGKTHPTLALASVKPHDSVNYAEPTDRVIERLELERRYAVVLGAPHIVADRSLLSTSLEANLETLSPFSRYPIPDTHQIADFLGYMKIFSQQQPYSRALFATGLKTDIRVPQAATIFKAAAWQQRLDVDITRRIRADFPITYGSSSIRSALQAQLFGAAL